MSRQGEAPEGGGRGTEAERGRRSCFCSDNSAAPSHSQPFPEGPKSTALARAEARGLLEPWQTDPVGQPGPAELPGGEVAHVQR